MKPDKSECICAVCENAARMYDSSVMLCRMRGVVPAGWRCRKFSYDPVKRIPPKSIKAPCLDYVDIDTDD